MRKIETVLFDLDDTLHDDTLAFQSAAEEVAREIEAEHGIDALALKRAYVAEAEGFWKRLSAEALAVKLSSVRAALWGSALRRVGLDDEALAERSAQRYNRYRTKYLSPFPDAVELLRTLRANGTKLGLVTNGFAETHREKIALLQIGDFFDAIFIADEVGMVKPDPLLFAHACTQLESSPARSAMVGDRYDRDIRGAALAGLYTVLVDVHGEAIPHDGPRPDAIVEEIGAVGAALLAAEGKGT
ncbi:MAG: HAD family hydrolase [Candidatus Eremiobacteraeota bacterium]|nr:HAD family hydrolase [Candidatus Eremiobacteraeota bacterium]